MRARRYWRGSFVDEHAPGRLAAAGVLLSMKRSYSGVDGGAADVVAGAQQELAALCLHHTSRRGVHIRVPSACLCHVAVRDRCAGPEQLRLYWSGLERSDTISKRLRMILHMLVTLSNPNLVPIGHHRSPSNYTGSRRARVPLWGFYPAGS